MIEYLHVRNFKALRDAAFPLSSLNLLSGLNGTGKSSLVQTLLLLRQSCERDSLFSRGLLLRGGCAVVGTDQDVVSQESGETCIHLTLKWQELPDPVNFVFYGVSHFDARPARSDVKIKHPEQLSLFNDRFQYLGSDRGSSRSRHELSGFSDGQGNALGSCGENTIRFIARYGNRPMSCEKLRHPLSKSSELLANINAWLSEVVPGHGVKEETVLSSNSFARGLGFHSVLPVITALVSARSGDLLIIENPELNLHPKGQAVIGKMCALAADAGIQVIIESHSDHLLNGIRVAVKKGKAPASAVKLFFFERQVDGKEHASRIRNLVIGDNGRISEWPDGFFDEWDNQLEQLL